MRLVLVLAFWILFPFTAAIAQTSTDQLKAVLIYHNMLDLNEIEVEGRHLKATWDWYVQYQYVLARNTGCWSQCQVQKSFLNEPGYPVTDYGIRTVRGLTAGLWRSPRLRADLESGDPTLLKLAQNYLVYLGYDVPVDGTLNEPTTAAADSVLREDFVIPQLYTTEDSEPLWSSIFFLADHLFLPLPSQEKLGLYLNAEDVLRTSTYPRFKLGGDQSFTNEQAIAEHMIDNQASWRPPTYERFVADYNAANDTVAIAR